MNRPIIRDGFLTGLKLWPAIVVLLLCCSAFAADTPTGIRLPASIVSVAPSAVTELAADAIFVIEADAPCLTLASRSGYVTITEESGPLRIRGRFADGNRVESRTYKAKQLWIIEALTAGEVEILIVPVGAKDESTIIRRTLVVGGAAPRPPPDPPITPKPPNEPVDPGGPRPDPLPVPLGLDKVIANAVRLNVPASERAFAANLAENYRIVATSLTTKEAKQEWEADPEKAAKRAIKTIFDLNTKTPGYKPEVWRPVFRDAADRLAEAVAAGQFKTLKQYIAVFAEFSFAFAEIAK